MESPQKHEAASRRVAAIKAREKELGRKLDPMIDSVVRNHPLLNQQPHGIPMPQPAPGFIPIEHAAKPEAPTGESPCPLVADFGRALAWQNTELKDRPLEMVCGESVTLRKQLPGSIVYRLVRKPKGASAKLSGARFTAGGPGLYIIEAEIAGGWRKEIVVAVFPEEAFSQLRYPSKMPQERRKRLRAIVRDPAVDAESIVSALEGDRVDFCKLLRIKPDTFSPGLYA